MRECLIDILNGRNTVLHVFPIVLENADDQGVADPEGKALQLAAVMRLVPEKETEGLHARPHVSRGGPLTPYGDVVETRCQMLERAEQRIRERAYFLWQHEGCPGNRADEHWHQARELEGSAAT